MYVIISNLIVVLFSLVTEGPLKSQQQHNSSQSDNSMCIQTGHATWPNSLMRHSLGSPSYITKLGIDVGTQSTYQHSQMRNATRIWYRAVAIEHSVPYAMCPIFFTFFDDRSQLDFLIIFRTVLSKTRKICGRSLDLLPFPSRYLYFFFLYFSHKQQAY